MNHIKRLTRRILREEIGRSYSSVNSEPFTFRRYPTVNVVVSFDTAKDMYYASVKPSDDALGDESMRFMRYFHSYEEAQQFARTKADWVRLRLEEV